MRGKYRLNWKRRTKIQYFIHETGAGKESDIFWSVSKSHNVHEKLFVHFPCQAFNSHKKDYFSFLN